MGSRLVRRRLGLFALLGALAFAFSGCGDSGALKEEDSIADQLKQAKIDPNGKPKQMGNTKADSSQMKGQQ